MVTSSVLSHEALREVRRVQLRTKRLVDTLLAGAYRSAFKGTGMEFDEVRAYEPGDDIRYIDWNVTARAGVPFIKRFREERELTVMLMVDVSASSLFGSGRRSKDALMAEIGALLAFSAHDNNDRVGLILFSNEVELYLPPKRGVRHTMRVIRELLAYQPKQRGTDISKALSFLGRIQKKSCICFLISDFLSKGFQKDLRLAARRYDLVAVRVRDAHEIKLPKLNLLRLRDLETDRTLLIDTSDTRVQKYFKDQIDHRTERQSIMMHRLGAGFIDIRSDEDYTQAIKRYFRSRKHKVK